MKDSMINIRVMRDRVEHANFYVTEKEYRRIVDSVMEKLSSDTVHEAPPGVLKWKTPVTTAFPARHFTTLSKCWINKIVCRDGRVVMRRAATPLTSVRFRFSTPDRSNNECSVYNIVKFLQAQGIADDVLHSLFTI